MLPVGRCLPDVGFMRRIIGVFALLVSLFLICSVFCACCTINVKTPSGPQLAQMSSSETVALVHIDQDGDPLPFCSGVWVSKTVILTANHCVEGLAEKITQENKDKLPDSSIEGLLQSLAAPPVEPLGLTVHYIVANEVVGVGKMPSALHSSVAFALYKSRDLALLRVVNPASVPPHGIAKLADKTPEQGEPINIMGHPHQLYWTYTVGNVAAYRKDFSGVGMDIDGPFMQVAGPVWNGNSGGGAYNDRGELIGIASFKLPVPEESCFIHVETIRSVLQGQKIIPVVLNLSSKEPDPSVE